MVGFTPLHQVLCATITWSKLNQTFMTESKSSHSLRFGIAAILFTLLGACSNTSSHARTKQASPHLTTGKNLAMVGLRSTVVAAVKQPVTFTRNGIVVLWHRPREIISANAPRELTQTSVIAEAPGSIEFEALLDKKRFPQTEFGKLTWLVDGPTFFPEFDRQIAAAQQSIQIQVFIFDNDDIGVRYADVLKRRSSEIPVHVLFDDLGSTMAHHSAPETLGPPGFMPPSNIGSYLRKNSDIIARRSLNPFLVCDHTKLMIFDEKIAFLGGMNLGREYYSEWHDLMVRVEGPIVSSLSKDFKRSWKIAGPWGDFALLRRSPQLPPPPSITGGIPLRLLRTDAAKGRHEILDVTLLAIRGSRRRIWIHNPYFAHDDIVAAVEAAARRGVDVRVIIPHAKEPTLMDSGNLSTAHVLIKAGAKVYMHPKMSHLKALICDDLASIGSANFDTLSMRINRELNLVFSDRATVKELENAVFLPDFSRSRRMHPTETKGVSNGLAETVADQL